MYKDESLKKYLDDLAARLPAPGGGSAAAMTAAMGAALISMVANFTVGKPKYAQHEQEIKGILEKSEKLRAEFTELVDRDVEAYKSKDVRKALDVPCALARLCHVAIQLCPPLITKGNVNLVSDVAVAAVFLEAAFAAASCNVEINLKMLGDEKLTKELRSELELKGKLISKIRVETEAGVGKIIRG